jgi:molybdate transport system regulatory protein
MKLGLTIESTQIHVHLHSEQKWKISCMQNLSLKFKIWLENDDNLGVLGDGKCRLLKTIHETGSLKEAMKIHELTYRKTWDNLNKIEKMLGFQIIERQRGGLAGGKTVLTSQGQAIVKAFDHFHEQYDSFIHQALAQTLKEIKQL